jgi:hypothetical protein
LTEQAAVAAQVAVAVQEVEQQAAATAEIVQGH